MKNKNFFALSLVLIITAHAELPQQMTGIGTRGTGFESQEQGIGTRGTGIGTRGTGLGTRGTGIGTRGTSNEPRTADDFLGLKVSKLGAVPYWKLYQNNALVLKVVLSRYLSSMPKSFDKNPALKAFAPLDFQDWASINAGELITKFEKTKWQLIEIPQGDNIAVTFEPYKDENVIVVSNTNEGYEQELQPGMISKVLTQFFLYAGAPFEQDEIEISILLFEKEITERTSALRFR